jgi:hypothetical protein
MRPIKYTPSLPLIPLIKFPKRGGMRGREGMLFSLGHCIRASSRLRESGRAGLLGVQNSWVGAEVAAGSQEKSAAPCRGELDNWLRRLCLPSPPRAGPSWGLLEGSLRCLRGQHLHRICPLFLELPSRCTPGLPRHSPFFHFPMKITQVTNHGRTRFRVNVQGPAFRKRLFFASLDEAQAFVAASGGTAPTSILPRGRETMRDEKSSPPSFLDAFWRDGTFF